MSDLYQYTDVFHHKAEQNFPYHMEEELEGCHLSAGPTVGLIPPI